MLVPLVFGDTKVGQQLLELLFRFGEIDFQDLDLPLGLFKKGVEPGGDGAGSPLLYRGLVGFGILRVLRLELLKAGF